MASAARPLDLQSAARHSGTTTASRRARPSMDDVDRTVVLRVLIAEDEEFQRQSLSEMFTSANRANSSLEPIIYFDTHLVSSADEVLETLRRDVDWQMVMLDIFMPGQHGDEIIGDVRAILGEKVPLLMLSAGAQMGAVQRCLRLGADQFVAKPVHLNVIRNLWQHCMLKLPSLFDGVDVLPADASVTAPPLLGPPPRACRCPLIADRIFDGMPSTIDGIPSLFDGVDVLPADASVPAPPLLGVAIPSDVTYSAPTAGDAGALCEPSRAAELVAQLEKLTLPSETTAVRLDVLEEDADPGACQQQ